MVLSIKVDVLFRRVFVLGRSVFVLLFQLNAPAFIHEGLEGKVLRGGRRWRGGCSRCVGEMRLRHHHAPCIRDFPSPCAYLCAACLALPMDWVR